MLVQKFISAIQKVLKHSAKSIVESAKFFAAELVLAFAAG
jgi:hypothetical protein